MKLVAARNELAELKRRILEVEGEDKLQKLAWEILDRERSKNAGKASGRSLPILAVKPPMPDSSRSGELSSEAPKRRPCENSFSLVAVWQMGAPLLPDSRAPLRYTSEW